MKAPFANSTRHLEVDVPCHAEVDEVLREAVQKLMFERPGEAK